MASATSRSFVDAATLDRPISEYLYSVLDHYIKRALAGRMAMADADWPVPRGRVPRTMPMAGFTARAAGGRMLAGLREKAGDAGAVQRFHERNAERYVELLGHSKGVLMKAGQMISMVDTGALGAGELSPYQRALTRLQSDAPPMDATLALEILQAQLGRPVDAVF